jgi:Tetratricopeptide repeat
MVNFLVWFSDRLGTKMMCWRFSARAVSRVLRGVAVSMLLALPTIDQSSAQFQCPAGSRPVSGGGGIMCQCPDGSYAGLYTGCSQQPPQTQIPAGSTPCGPGYCPPGTKCGSGGKCLSANVVDCGNGQACNPGQKCSIGGGCVPQETVDCGQGRYCNSGKVCLGRTQCITVASQKDRADCASNDPSRSIDGCTRVLADESKGPSDRANTYVNRGNAYFIKNDYDRAIADYDQAIGLMPDVAQYYAQRGIAYQQRAIAFPQQRDDLERAKADYSTSIELPASSDGLPVVKMARSLLAQILADEAKHKPGEATSVWSKTWATLSALEIENNILARLSAYLIEWVPLIERVPPYLRIAVLLAIALLLILYRGGYGQKSATAVSNAPSPQSDQQAPPSPLRTTARTHHEAPKKEEPKTRKPTESVSQRSPFDRGYK